MRRIIRLFAVLAFIVTAREQARADLILVLSPATQIGNPGGLFHFGGSLTNTGGTVVFLNGTVLSGSGVFQLNDTPFFANAPVSLTPGGMYTGPFFDIVVSLGTVPGTYGGSFAVLGGSTPSSLDVQGSQPFSVQVVATSITPEPSALVLLLSGLPPLLFVARRISSRKDRRTIAL